MYLHISEYCLKVDIFGGLEFGVDFLELGYHWRKEGEVQNV